MFRVSGFEGLGVWVLGSCLSKVATLKRELERSLGFQGSALVGLCFAGLWGSPTTSRD